MSIRVKAGPAHPAMGAGVFAFRSRDRRSLVAALERMAALAPRMSHRELQNLAHQLGRETAAASTAAAVHGSAPDPADHGEIRLTVIAGNQDQLAERARRAACLAGAVRGGPMVSEAGVHVSCGAGGRIVLVFPGGAVTDGTVTSGVVTGGVVTGGGVTSGVVTGGVVTGARGGMAWPVREAATLARSLAVLRWLEGLGVSATAAVGHSLGEIAGLVWAGSLPAPEAARLAAQHGEVRRGLEAARAAMVRLIADEATASALGASCGLTVAADEGPRSHVLAGPVAGVRETARQAAALDVTAKVLNAAHALHTPAMAPCAAPLRSVLAQIRFGPPRRRLISTVTGRELTAQDDIAAVLCAQLISPVRFHEALQAASDGADLILLAGADEALAAAAAACGVPVAGSGGPAECAAALFTAGALPDATALAPPAVVEADQPASRPSTPRPLVTPERAPAPGRFLETVTVLRPGAELEAEARITVRTDPYLADYLLDGKAVLPPAIGLEAMAQAASALARGPMRGARRVTFGTPVIIPAEGEDGGELVLRLRARVRADGVETILRAGAGEQLAECARAIFVGSGGSSGAAHAGGAHAGTAHQDGAHPDGAHRGGASRPGAARLVSSGLPASAEIVDGADLYGPVCFQAGRFRRIALVAGKPPRSCRAIVRGRDEAPWFGPLPRPAGRLVLGSPGLNDAALQVAQACVPGRRLLPGGCDSLTVTGGEVPGAVELRVFLISPPADGSGEYVWDIHGYDPEGHLVIAWIGLRMRDAGPLPRSGPADGHLLAPDAQPAGVAAHLQAIRPAAIPQQQVDSLSRAR